MRQQFHTLSYKVMVHTGEEWKKLKRRSNIEQGQKLRTQTRIRDKTVLIDGGKTDMKKPA